MWSMFCDLAGISLQTEPSSALQKEFCLVHICTSTVHETSMLLSGIIHGMMPFWQWFQICCCAAQAWQETEACGILS